MITDSHKWKKTGLAALLWLASALASALAAEASDLLAKANEAYHAADYRAADEGYQKLIENEQVIEAAVFFNAGNAAYKLKDTGRAVLNYRRALAVDPRFTQAARNLTFLEEQADRQFYEPGWLPPWIAALGATWPLVIACALFWMALFAALWRIKKGSSAKLATGLGASLLALAILSGALFALILLQSPGPDDFVIVDETAPLRTSPSDSAATAAMLTWGEPMKVLRETGDWAYVSSSDSQPGWIRRDAMEPVIPR